MNIPWWMEELYLYALNGHIINELVVCIPDDHAPYIEKGSLILDHRPGTAYVTVQDFLDDLAGKWNTNLSL